MLNQNKLRYLSKDLCIKEQRRAWKKILIVLKKTIKCWPRSNRDGNKCGSMDYWSCLQYKSNLLPALSCMILYFCGKRGTDKLNNSFTRKTIFFWIHETGNSWTCKSGNVIMPALVHTIPSDKVTFLYQWRRMPNSCLISRDANVGLGPWAGQGPSGYYVKIGRHGLTCSNSGPTRNGP